MQEIRLKMKLIQQIFKTSKIPEEDEHCGIYL